MWIALNNTSSKSIDLNNITQANRYVHRIEFITYSWINRRKWWECLLFRPDNSEKIESVKRVEIFINLCGKPTGWNPYEYDDVETAEADLDKILKAVGGGERQNTQHSKRTEYGCYY